MTTGTTLNKLVYDDAGAGQPLLLVHGFPLCRKMWRPQVERLAQAGCRVIIPDLRGFGESPLGNFSVSIDSHADDLVRLLDSLGIERAVVGGMSMGGYVLLSLLERYPERVNGAVFIVTKAGADDQAGRERRTALAEACRAEGIGPVSAAFRNLLFAPDTPGANPALVDEVVGWMNASDPSGAAASLLAMRDRPDRTELLGRVTVPVLVIGADRDQAIPVEQSRLLAERLPDAELCILHGAGHMVNLEQPEGFNGALEAFLNSARGR